MNPHSRQILGNVDRRRDYDFRLKHQVFILFQNILRSNFVTSHSCGAPLALGVERRWIPRRLRRRQRDESFIQRRRRHHYDICRHRFATTARTLLFKIMRGCAVKISLVPHQWNQFWASWWYISASSRLTELANLIVSFHSWPWCSFDLNICFPTVFQWKDTDFKSFGRWLGSSSYTRSEHFCWLF